MFAIYMRGFWVLGNEYSSKTDNLAMYHHREFLSVAVTLSVPFEVSAFSSAKMTLHALQFVVLSTEWLTVAVVKL